MTRRWPRGPARSSPVPGDGPLAAAGLLTFVAGALLARRPEVGRLERRWFGWMNRLHRRWFPPVWLVMQAGSLAGVPAVAGAVASTGRRRAARDVATAGLLAWVAAKWVKRFVGRGRPAAVLAPTRVLGREQSGLGYPSGHAAVTTAMALAAHGATPRRWRPLVWLGPAVVGCTRIYVGAHLPLDVVGGAALGVVCGSAPRLVPGHGSSSIPRSPRSSRRN